MEKYGITEEQAARVSVKNHRNGMKNGMAQVQKDFTLEDVLASQPLARPLKRLDVCPVSDSCSVLIMASEEKALEITERPSWIKGVGYCADAYYLGHRDLADLASCEAAARKAYTMAGIENPLEELDVAELYDGCTFHELMLYEGLGFCGKGEGGALIEAGVTEMGGKLPVNPSGGVLCGGAILAAGLTRMIEAAKQVRGEADAYQVEDARWALAHSTSGICLQSNVVYVLGRE